MGKHIETEKLGSGSFVSVYLAKHTNTPENVVVKKLKSVSIYSQMRFMKEAKILNSVIGHRNKQIFRILHSIMMQYSSFDFGFFRVEKSVSSLADFLLFVDTEFQFSSVANLLPVCVKDILAGLDYLHNHNIAHRDLKPSYILICNQHLNDFAHDDEVMARAYEECPIVCQLTDFGLSCSADIQT